MCTVPWGRSIRKLKNLHDMLRPKLQELHLINLHLPLLHPRLHPWEQQLCALWPSLPGVWAGGMRLLCWRVSTSLFWSMLNMSRCQLCFVLSRQEHLHILQNRLRPNPYQHLRRMCFWLSMFLNKHIPLSSLSANNKQIPYSLWWSMCKELSLSWMCYL